jgi:hypothetical protein
MIVTGDPVAGVKVMLVNKNANIDTTDYAKNAVAFVDSAITDANGAYMIDGVKPGDYGVVPLNADSTATYKFSAAQGSGPYEFSMNGETRTAHFIAEKMDVPGADGSVFTIVLYLKNANSVDSKVNMFIQRRYWTMFFSFWEKDLIYAPEYIDSTTRRVYMQFPYGYTSLFYTLDNWFKVFPAFIPCENFEFGFPLGSTPAYSVFEYDLSTKTLTRKE